MILVESRAQNYVMIFHLFQVIQLISLLICEFVDPFKMETKYTSQKEDVHP